MIAKVADCAVEDVQPAIAAAAKAQKEWYALTAKQRSTLLRAFQDRMLHHQTDLARIMTLEQGKPLAESMGEIAYGASYVEWYAEEAKRVYGDIIPAPAVDRKVLVLKQPVGVAAMVDAFVTPCARHQVTQLEIDHTVEFSQCHDHAQVGASVGGGL